MSITLSVIIPAYNESKRIGVTLSDLKRYFEHAPYEYEVIVVNDGSKDDTAAVVSAYQQDFPALKLVDNVQNRGKGYAVKTGMLEARGDYRLFMDADNSVTIDTIEPFFSEMVYGKHDVIIGSIAFSYMPTIEHNGWHRRFFGSMSKFLVRVVATPGIYDTQRGFKLFTRKAAETIFPLQKIDRFGFDIELLTIARLHNFSIKEMPVVWDNPAGSTVRLRAYIDSFIELWRIYANVLRGKYDPQTVFRLRRKKASTALLFLYHFPSLFYSFIREALVSRVSLDIQHFDRNTESKRGKGLIYKGKEFVHHTNLHHSETALYTIVRAQKVFLYTLGILFILALAVNWHLTILLTISLITILYFIDLLFNSFIIVRSFSQNPEVHIEKEHIESIPEHSLPRYTIFCPLYREWQVVPQFVKAMEKLDYPREKLQIMFLLEENDKETIQKVRDHNLPAHFQTVVVPHSYPKTKPKAMNYGLKYATGEYLVIYDAEDMPEPDQLKKAVAAFERSREETVCVQAKLNFYNIEQNVLTRIFTTEYSLWFDLVLPGLQSLDAPIPLGGTSNHFKVNALRQLSGWDAFNVTEDCDLGMRLAKRGYRTSIVESTTYEEANSDMRNWYNQRSRWIKGYIQTYLVHMRNPKSFKGGIRDFLTFQVIVGGKIFSMIVNPIFWTITLCYFLFRAEVGIFIESFFPAPVLLIGVASFIFGNFLYLYNYMIGCAKRKFDYLIKYVFIIPFYWLGMSIASWKALYEIFVKPHYWSKTIHGLHLKASPVISSPQTP
jgi:cellulose synthase/poly-beta-1,6-N-acetylglucosamine synthase-like glycosyltransferase